MGDRDSSSTCAQCFTEVGGGTDEVLEAGGWAECVGPIAIDLNGKVGRLGQEMS